MNNLKMYVFYCSNSLEKDQLTNACVDLDGVTVKTIGLPCSGKIDIPYLVKAFETGADGAVIITCKRNECQHLEGNLRAQKRAEAVGTLLEEIGMSKERMAVIMLKEDGVEQVLVEIKGFFDSIKNLPQQQAQSGSLKA